MSDTSKPQWERHIQSVLLAFIVLGVGITGRHMAEIRENQNQASIQIAAQGVRMSALGDRFDRLASDRYTGTQAAQDRLQIAERLSTFSNDLREVKSRINALEQQVARLEAGTDDPR